MKTKFKKLLASLLAISFAFSLSACGGSGYNGTKQEAATEEAPMACDSVSDSAMNALTGQEIGGKLPEGKERKLTYSSNISISTLDFQKTIEDLEELIKKNNIIVSERSSYSNDNYYRGSGGRNSRSVSFFLRVPMDKYEDTISSLSSLGHITNQDEKLNDITKTYYDSEARLGVLEAEKERLLSWLKEAKTIEDMLKIEERLVSVQGNIEGLKNSLEVMDFDVSYSKLSLDIYEVYRYDAPANIKIPYLTELKDTFKESFQGFGTTVRNLSLSLVLMLPYIIIIVIIVLVVRKLRQKRGYDPKAKKEERLKKKQEKQLLREEKVREQREKDERFKEEQRKQKDEKEQNK